MTRQQFAHLGPLFEADLQRHGLQTALELFLGRSRGMLAVAQAKPRPGEMTDGVRRVIEMVAARHDVPVRMVTGMSRYAKAVEARHEAWFRLAVCGFSGPGIAKMFRCNPSSIVTARQSFRERHAELAAEIEEAAARPPVVVAGGEGRVAA